MAEALSLTFHKKARRNERRGMFNGYDKCNKNIYRVRR